MWDLPGPGLEPVFPALAGGFLTTVPPRKSLPYVFNCQISSGLLSKCTVQNVLRPHALVTLLQARLFERNLCIISKFSSPVFCSYTDKNFWLRLGADKREERSLWRLERQRGAGSNGTNVVWGLSSPPLLASVMDPHSDTQVSNQERGRTRTGQVGTPVAGPLGSLPTWKGLGTRIAAPWFQGLFIKVIITFLWL